MDSSITNFLTTNWMLIAVAFVSGAMLIFPALQRGRGGPVLSTLEATRLINSKDAVVIDVRDQGDYAKSHIANAKNIPEKLLEERKAELEKLKGVPFIVACATGQRAPTAAEAIRKLGFEEVFVLNGGQAAWTQAGLPVTK